jgi:hypothetical protein
MRNNLWKFMRVLVVPLWGVTVMGGCVAGEIEEGTTQAALTGDHSKTDQRAEYGLTGTGVARTLGLEIGPINSAQFSQLETDLASMGISCTRSGGCLTILNQSGSSVGPWPVDDSTQEKNLRARIFEMFTANPGLSGLVIVVANDLTVPNGHTAFTTLDGQSIAGGHLGIDYSETATGVTAFQTDIAASSKVYTARAGKFPGQSPNVVAAAATDYGSLAVDSVWSGSAAACSTVFSAQSYEPASCAGGMRAAADVAAVGHNLPIVFNGSAITVDDLSAPAAFWLGRLSLQTSAIATRADVFAGASSKHTDVTAGTDSLGQTAVAGFDKASGIGVPKGNLTK